MRSEIVASLFGTGFSLWNARAAKSANKPSVLRFKQTFYFGTARAPTNWNERGTIVPEEQSNRSLFLIERRRAERRYLVHVPVEVTEIDAEGRSFTERTFIEDVSDFGCRFSTRGLVQQGDTVTVKLLGPDGNSLPGEEPRLFEIMWTARKERGTTVGARLLQGEKLDKIKSLPEYGGPKRDAK